jgi:hypothetical protein
MDHTAVREYTVRKNSGEQIRKVDNRSKKEVRIVNEAIMDFRDGRLSVKEFLYLIAGRYQPCETNPVEEMSEVKPDWEIIF